jgi:hypothetical protein
MTAFTIRHDRDLEHESRPKYLPACAARLLHDLIEAASSEPGQLFGGIVDAVEPIARQALATGGDAAALARALIDRLAGPGLKLAFVFADHRLAPSAFAEISRALSAPVIGGSAASVLGPNALGAGTGPGTLAGPPAAVGLGLYGDWLRVGVGVAGELSHGGLARGRDAVHQAVAALGTTVDALDPGRHVAIAVHDGTSPGAEAFCIGAAASVAKLRFLGGGAGDPAANRASVWAMGEARGDAGVVVVLDSDQPFHVVSSSHLVASELKTVVTAVSGSGRAIDELDGRPAATRLGQLVESLGDALETPHPIHAFARFLDGVPYVRSIASVVGERLILASAVEPGHVLRVMRPGELVRTTSRDLTTAHERVGGTMAALLAFSSQTRQREAALRHNERELAAIYATCPMVGFHTVSEQSGMLLLNHTLTGLAIGAMKP